MPSDPTKPLLKLTPQEQRQRPKGQARFAPPPDAFPQSRQTETFSPKFKRIAEVLARDPSGLELRTDPTALAPERLLVFEVRGPFSSFATAIQKIPGLELVDEEERPADQDDKSPVAYLMVPDARALKDIESLWRRWLLNKLVDGEAPWRDVFEHLRDLRPWGPKDRIQTEDSDILSEEIEGRSNDDLIMLEIELIFRTNERLARKYVASP